MDIHSRLPLACTFYSLGGSNMNLGTVPSCVKAPGDCPHLSQNALALHNLNQLLQLRDTLLQ